MKVFLFVLCLLLSVSTALFAADEYTEDTSDQEQHLEAVSVTATRLERKTSEVPASVVVVGEEDLKNTKMFNLKEALAGTPGVLIDTRNQGYDSRLIIRGAGLKARYGVRDIMVLLDGVPITDPDSLTRLDFIDTQLIERIEVVKGPNSTLWGANAAGGVINIITKSPFERKGGVLKAGAGDYNTQAYHGSYSNNIGDAFFYTVSGSRRQSDNSWRRWNEFETTQFSVQPSFLFSDGATLENHFNYTDASLQLPGALDEDQFAEYKKTGRARETEGPWQFMGRYSEIYFFSSKYTKDFGDVELRPLIYLSKWSHHHPVTGRINDADTMTYGTDLQLNYGHKVAGMPGTLTTGLTARFDDQETDYFEYADVQTIPGGRIVATLSDNAGRNIENQTRETLLWGVYIQESINPGDRWLVDLGARFDQIRFDISGTKIADYDWGSGTYVDCPDPRLVNCGKYSIDKTYDAFSPRVGMTYKVSKLLNIYGSVSSGIQTPTESEFSENPGLDLVTIQNYEIGTKSRHRRWMVDTALYYSPVKDEIIQVVQEDGVSEYVNAGETQKIGFEITGAYSIIAPLSVGASYAYSDYTFVDFSEPVRVGAITTNEDRSGNRLPYIPEHQYSVFANYKDRLGIKFRIQADTWGSYYMDNANTETYAGYSFVTNVMVGYEKGNFDIALNVDNVFDKRYAVEVTKDTRDVKRYNPAAPRTFIVRAAYHF